MNEDLAYTALKEYSANLTTYIEAGIMKGLTESDTRAKFIDVFLRECLGWPEANIRREFTYWDDSRRAAIDYTLSVMAPMLVVEAKKAGLMFELPNNRSQFIYSLSGTVQSCPVLWSAIQQARAYCDGKGVPYGLERLTK